jgi:hypothetical protein
MRIVRLHLRDFRRHPDLEIVPAAGLTAIVGPNEAGKSSIQEALEMVLFRKADSASQATQDVQRWGAREPAEVTLDFEADGMTGRLTKTFAGSRGAVELVIGDEVIRDPNAVQRRIEDLTGLAGEKFFRSTASVRHHELTEVASDDHQISDRLQVVVSGSGRGTAQARRKLEDAVKRYRTEGPRNPGLLKVERERVAALERELNQGEGALARLEADRGTWVAAHQRRLELDAQVARLEAEVAEHQRAADLVDRQEQAQARYERLRRACDLDEERRRIEATGRPGMALSALRAQVSRVQGTVFELSELEAALSVGPEAAATPADLPVPPKPWPFIVAALLLTIGAIVAYVALDRAIGLAVVLGLAVVAALSLFWSMRVAREARRVGLELDMAHAAIEEQQRGAAERDEAFRRKRRDLEAALETIDVKTPEEAATLLSEAETREADLARIDGELRGLLGDVLPDDLPVERDRAANDAERAAHALRDMPEGGRESLAAVKRLRNSLTSVQSERDAARSEEDRVLGRIESEPADADAVAALAERLEEARTRLAAMQHRVSIYEGTLEALRRAESATMKTAARYVEERMGPDLATITGGRYDSVRVDERDLSFRVWSSERGDEVDARVLSRGTADQLYLVARLGLVRLVTLDRRPPLILDDPFVTFDDARAARALEVVKRLSADLAIQVLHLTASERHLDLADAVVRLPAPALVAAAPPPSIAARRASTPAPPVRAPRPAEPAWPKAALALPDPTLGDGDGQRPGMPDDHSPAVPDHRDDHADGAPAGERPDEPEWPAAALARPGDPIEPASPQPAAPRRAGTVPNPRHDEPEWPAAALARPEGTAPTDGSPSADGSAPSGGSVPERALFAGETVAPDGDPEGAA